MSVLAAFSSVFVSVTVKGLVLINMLSDSMSGPGSMSDSSVEEEEEEEDDCEEESVLLIFVMELLWDLAKLF